ncbi:MAG: DUF58 domain-containing protein [Deltaproteobacteria bacterium]|nr:DUF58 domain-containing protein [Deltaproteobacteria bacterium]
MTYDLLDAGYRRSLDLLRRHLSPAVAAGTSGDHRTRHRGSGQEFQDHRPYVPGDDLRRVDWMAYARTGEPVTRNLRAEEDVLLRVLIDTSASMTDGKLAHAARIAAGVGYLGLLGGERVQVIPFADAPDGRRRPERGRAAIPSLLRSLGPLHPSGGTDLRRALDLALSPGSPLRWCCCSATSSTPTTPPPSPEPSTPDDTTSAWPMCSPAPTSTPPSPATSTWRTPRPPSSSLSPPTLPCSTATEAALPGGVSPSTRPPAPGARGSFEA